MNNDEFKYIYLKFEDFFKFGKQKISEIVNISNLNQINLISSNNSFLYHVRNLNQEKESFKHNKWFVIKPEDLFVIFIFRIWQSFDFNKKNFGISDWNFYKENILVDVYYTKDVLSLVKFNRGCYNNLENFVSCIDSEYKINKKSSLDQFDLSNWLEKNKNKTGIDGWLEEKNREIDNKYIDEIMIISSSIPKLDLVYTDSIENIINLNYYAYSRSNQSKNKKEFINNFIK